MTNLLNKIAALPEWAAWGLFLLENVLLTGLVLGGGRLLLQKLQKTGGGVSAYTRREWVLCGITNILNTVVTYAGFWLWKKHFITITMGGPWRILPDFLLLFFSMDLLMFLFHFLIHKTFLYRSIHLLHHGSIDPKPIDLFILHPVETLSFGTLWLVLLILYPFNIYAILIYLTVNLVFGLTGHLGMEPLPENIQQLPVLRWLGGSTFHHHHHKDIHYNFGFYTTIWDRLFGTLHR
jgi:Delta7-sterol 5-desaturase